MLSLGTLGTRGAYAVVLWRGPQADKRHLEKLPAMLEKVHSLDVELAHAQDYSLSNTDIAGKTIN